MTFIPSLPAAPPAPRAWWMTAVATGQTSDARLPLSHLGSLPRGAILVSLANFIADAVTSSAGDPGTGKVRWNHATQASATEIYIDDSDADANDLTSLWASLEAGGFLYLYNPANLDVWQQWSIVGVSDESGYLKLTVAGYQGGGSFSDAASVVLTLQQPEPLATDANQVAYDNSASGMTADDVQAAIDELKSEVDAFTPGADRSLVTALAIASGVVDIDVSLGDFFTLLLNSNVTSITFSNLPPAGKGASIALQVKQDTTGGRSLALPSSFKATGNSDTAVQGAANAYTLITATTFDQGARWAYAMQEVAS